MEKIDSFRGKYFFLSNFYRLPIEVDGYIYPTSEHAYQAAKCSNEKERRIIQNCSSPGESKRRVRDFCLRSDWDKIKLGVMEKVLRIKFSNDKMRKLLLSTNKAELVEGNTWGDTYWGQVNGFGQNNLGKLLMKIRSELQNAS